VKVGLVAVAALLCGVAACSGGGSNAASSTSTTARPVTPPPSSAAPAPPPCAPFRGVTSELRSGEPRSPGLLTDASAGAAGCLDQVTFTFMSLGDGTPPGYDVKYKTDLDQHPFMDGDPPAPISLPGSAFLVVTMTPASSTNPLQPDNPQTYLGDISLQYGDHHHLMIVRKLPDTAHSVRWVIGLDGTRPFLVDRAAEPTRITVYIG
jgi:hypothetical protein